MRSVVAYISLLVGCVWGLTWHGHLCAQPAPRSSPFVCAAKDLTPDQANELRQQAILAFKKKRSLRATSASITYVPIRPHIVRRSDGTEGFDLNSLNMALAAVNRHFLFNGSGIQFYFAGTTPDYINNDSWYYAFPVGSYDPAVDGYDAHNALNQYYASGLDLPNVTGIAGAPANNVISTRSVIKVASLSLKYITERVIPHELGHTFGLIHTFGPGPAVDLTSELVTRGAGANCETAGDELCDTPADPYTASNTTYDPTNPPLDANGDPFVPSLSNIMSYYPNADNNDFTPGQYNRMQAGLALRQTHTAYTLDYSPTNVIPISNLTATPNGVSILLTWQDNATNEMGYLIERSTYPTDGFVPIGGVGPDATSFRDAQTTPLTQYYYRVRPSNSTTDNLSSTVSITNTTVPTVTGLTTSNITGTTALLSWNSVGDGATYELRWRPVGTANWNTVTTTDTNYGVGLLTNTTYEWQVRAIGGETYAGPVYFTTLCPAPESPSSNPSRATASLTWNGITGQMYAVRWRVAGSATWNTINTVTSTPYLLTGLTALTAYEWQVQSLCSATVSSAFTDSQSFTTFACANPYYANTNGVRSSSADIYWSSPNDDPSRTAEIRYRVVGASAWTIISGISSASSITYLYSLTGLANNTTYEWQLRNNCSATETSDYTPLATFTTTCRLPTGLSSSGITATRALFSWSSNGAVDAGATYEISYRPAGSATWTIIGGITGGPNLTYPLTGLTINTQYEWRVRTICSPSAQSDYSASGLFTTGCNAPNANGLTASLVTSTSVQLNWNTLNDPNTSYTIRYRPVGAADWLSVTTSAPTSTGGTYVLTGLTNNTQYEWQIQSMCSAAQVSNFIAGPSFTTQCRTPSYSFSTPMLSSVFLTWQPVGADVTYEVRYRTLDATDWTVVSGITSASALITGLTVSKGYEWAVRARCQDGIITDYLSAAFATSTCTAPASLQTNPITATSARLIWYFPSASPDTHFEIRYRPISTTTWTSIPNLTVTYSSGFVDLTGLSPDTQYQWQIRSICSSTENSVFSSPLSFRTLAPCLSMYTVRTGLWNDPSIWSCNRVPLGSDAVQIKHPVTIPTNYQAQALRIAYDAGQQLIISTGSVLQLGQ